MSATESAQQQSSPHQLGLPPGTVVGDFRLERVLGRPGGQGVVYAATQISLNRRVALKLLKEGGTLSERTLRRFQREAEAGSRISHPGLAAVHAFGEAEGCPYLVQELVQGGDLREHLDTQRDADRNAADYRDIATLFADLCDALQAAHDAGVIHRDLKPANILLTTDSRPKVVDFGLAKVLDAESLSATGELEGTPFYMSPEQAAPGIRIDRRTDVFSLGATLYEALTLTRPFQADTLHQLVEKVLHEDPPEPQSVRSRIPRELSLIAMKALEKRRPDRYQSMAEFGADLRRWLANEPILAKPPGSLRRTQKWALRHPTASMVLGVALVSAAVLAWLTGQLSSKNTELGAALVREFALKTDLQQTNAALVDANAATTEALAEAETQRALAEDNADDARREKANVLRLSAFQELEDLRREADTLWPPTPDKLDDYEAWLDRATDVVAGLEPSANGNDIGHRRQLLELRARALPRTDEQRRRDRESHPSFAAWNAKRAEVEAAETQLADTTARVAAAGLSAEQAAVAATTLERAGAALDAERETLAALDATLDERRTFTFVDAKDTWWHNQLVGLIAEIESFTDPDTGLIEGVSTTHGWGVERRRAFAAAVLEQTLTGPEARRRWEAATGSIADRARCPAYDGMELSPQLGLLPIGRDPESGLWEFWHVMSGDEPRRGDDGRLELEHGSGIVLVLVPGGTFAMGAQNRPGGPNHDAEAQRGERPVHAVTLSPYMLSKYELTQGQWRRFTSDNPSQYVESTYFTNWNRDGRPWSPLHPVEQVSWEDAMSVLPRLGLVLPTEAQWERACRAGTSTPWSTGAAKESLQGAVNLSDQYGKDQGNAAWSEWEAWLDDGQTAHAPVGSYEANAFGLHDMHGNVWEWCLDAHEDDFYDRSPSTDPVNLATDVGRRVFRGGSFLTSTSLARSAFRHYNTPEKYNSTLGLRPARAITP